jgi:hypothetical protein
MLLRRLASVFTFGLPGAPMGCSMWPAGTWTLSPLANSTQTDPSAAADVTVRAGRPGVLAAASTGV